MDEREDVYGRLILDAIDGKKPIEVVERDDGFVFAYHGDYLIEPFRRWQPVERRAQRFVRGRVLDIGCGAGRVCLHLQERGLDVVGIDNSPGAVQGCRRRGVKDVRLWEIGEIDGRLGSFDTLVMLANNFGLIGGEASARRVLRAMHAVTRPGGRLLGQSFDPQGDPGQWGYATRRSRAMGVRHPQCPARSLPRHAARTRPVSRPRDVLVRPHALLAGRDGQAARGNRVAAAAHASRPRRRLPGDHRPPLTELFSGRSGQVFSGLRRTAVSDTESVKANV